MFDQHATEIITRVMNDEPYRLAINGVTDAQNAQTELEAALQRVFAGYLDENMDLYRAYADYPDFKKRLCEYVFQHTYVEAPTQEPQETPPTQTPGIEPDDTPAVLAALDEYNCQKETHPKHIVLVQVGDHYETYGEDAKLVAPILNANLLERAVPGAGNIEMTGFTPASMWADYGKQLGARDTTCCSLDHRNRAALKLSRNIGKTISSPSVCP